MLRRTAFKSKAPVPRQATQYTGAGPTPRPTVLRLVEPATEVLSLPKENAVQHLGYMATVRTLACARCGWYRKGEIQFCHSDRGKGLGLKTDCRRGWPGCGPHEEGGRMVPGCHWYVGTSGRMTQAERRSFESTAAAATRTAIFLSGRWPKQLPRWTE